MWTTLFSWSGPLPHLTTILAAFAVFLFSQGGCYGLAIAAPHQIARSPNQIAPQLKSGDGILAKRATVPSVPFIREKILAGGQMTNKISIYWNNFQPTADGRRLAITYGQQVHGCNTVVYDMALPQADYMYLNSNNPDDPSTPEQYIQKIQVLSAAFAQTSSGTVYVLLPADKEFNPDSVWINYEFPNLTRNSAVTDIQLVRSPDFTQQTLWTRSDGAQGVWPPAGADATIFSG